MINTEPALESSTETLISALRIIAQDMNEYRTFTESTLSLYHCTLIEAAERLEKFWNLYLNGG